MLKEAAEVEGQKESLAANGIVMTPNSRDIRKWLVKIKGPPSSPYEGGTFHLEFEATSQYP